MSFHRHQRTNDAGIEVRSGEGGAGPVVLRGYAAVFGEWAVISRGVDPKTNAPYEVRETIRRGAFRRAIESGQDVRALVDHNPTLILGRTRAGTLKLWEDERGLGFDLALPNTQAARDLAENIRLGNISQNSFAFLPRRPGGEHVASRSEGAVVVHESTLVDVDLYDVSIVTYPAYASTSVEISRRAAGIVAAAEARTAIVADVATRFASLESRFSL